MELKYESFKQVLINIFVGVFIGLSVIVPGISGSTMAITMKVYDKGMYAFSHMFKEFKKCFLYALPVLVGIFFGFFSGVVAVKLLLEYFPFMTICFFLGLMIGTYPVIFKEIKGQRVNASRTVLSVVGFVLPIVFSALSLIFSGDANTLTDLNFGHYIFFFVLGALISITQLMPGLSATVLMMVFGYYKSLIGNLGREMFSDFKIFLVYVVMGCGFLVGVFTFSKAVEAILSKARVGFFFVIAGISLGSVVSVFMGKDCVDIYKGWESPELYIELFLGICLLLCAFALSFMFTRISDSHGAEKISTEKN